MFKISNYFINAEVVLKKWQKNNQKEKDLILVTKYLRFKWSKI